MKTYEKLTRFIELNDDGPQSCLNTTFTQDHKRKMIIRPYESLTWKMKHTSFKYIKQPSQLCTKHVYTKKHHIDNKMQCMQINKYDHEHDGGSKKENQT
jgi:hypothetical protein